jgi:death on curing protein
LPHSDLYSFIIKIASGNSSLEECKTWFENNIVPIQ